MGQGERFALCANAHLSDDETVAKMGHPSLWFVLDAGHPPDPKSVRRDLLKLVRVGVLRTREEINPGHGRVKIVETVAEKFVLKTSL